MLRAKVDDRSALLALAPVELRPLLSERLKSWDQISSAARDLLLENEKALGYFVQLDSVSPERKQDVLVQIPDKDRAQVEAQFLRWQALPQPA